MADVRVMRNSTLDELIRDAYTPSKLYVKACKKVYQAFLFLMSPALLAEKYQYILGKSIQEKLFPVETEEDARHFAKFVGAIVSACTFVFNFMVVIIPTMMIPEYVAITLACILVALVSVYTFSNESPYSKNKTINIPVTDETKCMDSTLKNGIEALKCLLFAVLYIVLWLVALTFCALASGLL